MRLHFAQKLAVFELQTAGIIESLVFTQIPNLAVMRSTFVACNNLVGMLGAAEYAPSSAPGPRQLYSGSLQLRCEANADSYAPYEGNPSIRPRGNTAGSPTLRSKSLAEGAL